ncbi:YopX family protein [Bacillus altitudinis]|uniref:YopX family protein n=1 Tax=Bacillus altitudinis TaxID=293387 RepID=UPI0020221537|nr:YopX family protein [Bacillus altitudinis]MCL7873828.1 YopX family protein [Bacillus altitudinis]
MRNTKFRVWDENAQEMVYEVGLTPEGIPYSIPDHAEASDQFDYYPSCHKMQFTGLRDSKGVDIYEGDIVRGAPRYQREDEIILLEKKVSFLKGCYMFGSWNAHEYFNKHQHIEVVGNLYEDPDLWEEAR